MTEYLPWHNSLCFFFQDFTDDDSASELSDPNDFDFVPRSYKNDDTDDSSYQDLPPFFDPPQTSEFHMSLSMTIIDDVILNCPVPYVHFYQNGLTLKLLRNIIR